MADVKWIKLTTDMFDNRKIKYLRRLPEGDSIVLIWVMLLTMAGRCNAGGMIFLTENIPYTPKSLADELDFEENTVKLALGALEQLNMIVTNEGFFAIAGWEEYQNIEGMDKIREQNRLRQKKWYDKNKVLNAPNDKPNVSITQPNATDKEEEIEEDKEKEKENSKAKRKRFSPPSLEEVTAYCAERGNKVCAKTFYDYFKESNWYDSKGKKVQNWKQKVITWERYADEKKAVGANGIAIDHKPSVLDDIF